ncbi:MAG: cupin domain-containing protein [Acidobacteriota bacterium]
MDKTPDEKRRATVGEALARLPLETGERSVTVFEHGTLLVKLYAPRDTDPQTPHSRDEVYIVAHGKGDFVLQGQRQHFGPGDFLFAAAGEEHRFENFTDLAVWVMFYGPEGGEAA